MHTKKSLIIIPRNNTKRRDVFKKQNDNDKFIRLSTTLNFSCKTSLSDIIKRTEKQSNIYLQLTKKRMFGFTGKLEDYKTTNNKRYRKLELKSKDIYNLKKSENND
jgi:hypothetical protein